MKILNAFSLQMLPESVLENGGLVRVQPVEKDWAMRVAPSCESAIGHADTAAVLGVPCNRVNVTLAVGEEALVCQLVGGRPPEGSTTLPEGFSFKFFLVKLEDPELPAFIIR